MSEFEIHRGLLTAILGELKALNRRIGNMTVEMDALKAAVAKDTEVDTSAVTLLQGLKKALDDLIAQGTVTPADLQALSDQLGQNTDSLAAAVAANTPAAT